MSKDKQVSDELGIMMERKINTLAALLYQSNGRVFSPDNNFRESNHPEEYGCWNKAIIAYSYINNDSWFLEYQVTR